MIKLYNAFEYSLGIYLFLVFIPFSIIIQSYAKFILIFSFILFFIEIILKKNIIDFIKNISPLLPYFLFVFFSFLFSIGSDFSYIISIVRTMLLLTILFYISRKKGEILALNVVFPLIIYAIFCLFILSSFFDSFLYLKIDDFYFIGSGLIHGSRHRVSHLSILVGISVFLSLNMIFKQKPNYKKFYSFYNIYYLFSIIIGFYLIVVKSGSRQGIIWFILAVAFSSAVYAKKKTLLITFTIVPSVFIFLVMVYYFFRNTLTVQRILAVFDFVSIKFGTEGSFLTRLNMVKTGFNMWAKSILFGHGNNAFKLLSGFNMYSHNNYIELLVNYGLIGFVLFYYRIFAVFFKSFNNFIFSQSFYLKKNFLWIIFSILAILASNFFMPIYHLIHIPMFLGVVMGRFYYLKDKQKITKKNEI